VLEDHAAKTFERENAALKRFLADSELVKDALTQIANGDI
jgi:hypothetical protein